MLSNVGDRAAEVAATGLDKTLLTPLTALVMAAAETLLNIFLQMWLKLTSFDLEQQGAMRLYGMTLSIGMMIAVILLIWQAIRTMIQGRGLPLLEAFQGLVITGLVSLCGVAVTGGVMRTSDLLSEWILGDLARNGLLNRQIVAMLTSKLITTTAEGAVVKAAMPAWLTIQLATLLILVLIIQVIVLWLRNATIPILALMLPIAAAGSIGTNATRAWLPKTITAILTVAAYKPIVSLIIVAAVAQFRESTEIAGLLYALIMFVLAVIAMPALVKIFAPLGVAAAGGGAGSWLSQAAWMATSKMGGGGSDSGGAGPGSGPTSATEQEQRMQQGTPSSQHQRTDQHATGQQSSTDAAPGTSPVADPQSAQLTPGADPAPATGGTGAAKGGVAAEAGATGSASTAGAAGSAGTASASGAAGAGSAAAGAAGPVGAVNAGAGVVVGGAEQLGQAAGAQVAAPGQTGEQGQPAATHPLERAERDSGGRGGGGSEPAIIDRNYG
ncbi:hypothetical protein [Nonomuraea dietziae]|uniref:hypothetical protein n=1 Tax=Nonomuraea dietziae TaxID=65515 RepID=UPI00332B495C